MGKVIAVFNQKGGVGKTTTNVNLTASLGAMGKKILVLDLDPQGNTTSGYGIDKQSVDGTIYDVIIDGVDINETILNTEFENIFIDCPPSLGMLTINSLTAVDSVLIPIQCEYYALEGVSQLMGTIKLVKSRLNPNLDIQGVVLSMFDGRANLSIQVVDEVKRYFKGSVYTTLIPRNVRLAEAPSHGKPVIYYDSKCKGAVAYMELAEEFIDLEEDII